MERCQLPPALQPGDRLCVVAPSGTLREPERERFAAGVALWQQQGYVVDLLPGWDGRWGYLAGTDPERRQQLLTAWQDPDCKGILCARGGWGGARLLEHWQWPETAQPKWLIGFSDITSLLWSLALMGVSGVHGPLLTTLGAEPTWSQQRLFKWVTNPTRLEPLQGTVWQAGAAEGLLLPANLTVATHLLSTPYQPDFENVILALEDVGEAPYRLDRLLTHWRLSGLLQRVQGIALGRFSRCDAPENVPTLTTEVVLRDRLTDLGIPVIADLPFGHEGVNAVLPVGRPVRLNGDTAQLQWLA